MGKILDEAKPAEEMKRESYLLKTLICSESGGGKTTGAALTLPKPVLLLDYDNRAQSVVGFEGIDVIPCFEADSRSPKAWDRAENIRKEIWVAVRGGTFKYASVLEDGLSSLNRICMNWALLLDPKRGLGGSPAKQHYGLHIKNLADHILSMIALPVHYCLTGHFNLTEDEETGAHKYLPKIYGKQARTDVPTWFDECYLAYHKTDEKEHRERYYWHTAGFGRYEFFKSTLNQLGKFWKNPVEVDLEESPAGFEKLLELRFGEEGKVKDEDIK